ncbi:hypothetical protein PHSC3_001329 [Chlamydiales bacterium STE3]|nr:hypothetical protein PHSC3_001329 [Chlamydiales bacterium STE3]
MKITKILYVLIGCMLAMFFSVEAYERKYSSCVESQRTNDGKNGYPGCLEDGENREDGQMGKDGQDGGYGGNGGGSVYGNGGDGGNGGDAE